MRACVIFPGTFVIRPLSRNIHIYQKFSYTDTLRDIASFWINSRMSIA